MTAIAGVAHGGNVWIGGDSAGVSGWTVCKRKDVKVFRKGAAIIGFAGSFRGGQLLRSSAFKMPEKSGADTYDYMVTSFVNAVRECFKTCGHATKANEEEGTGTDLLIGLDGRLFSLQADYQIGETLTGYNAVGCGRATALGSLHTSAPFASLMPPKARVLAALKAANDHNGGVCPPFEILEGTPWL